MTNKEHIVFLDAGSLPVGLKSPSFPHTWNDFDQTRESDLIGRLAGATIAVTNKVPLRAATLRQLPELRLIAVAATGTDVIDLEACKELGIEVRNIRGYAVRSLPEHVFAMALALRRSLAFHAEAVASGRWTESKHFCVFSEPMHDLGGSTLGLLGYGALGRAVAAIGQAFGMRVLAYDQAPINESGITASSFETVLEKSDVLSLHLPLTPDTHNLIGEVELKRMKPSSILINTARGGLIEETALATALRNGVIGGAGIDVLSDEPPSLDNPLLRLKSPRLIVTPHVAWASEEAMRSLADQLIDNIDTFVAGKAQAATITPLDKVTSRRQVDV